MQPAPALPGLDLATLFDVMPRHMFLMLRIGAFLLSSPFFGTRFVPLQVRIIAAAVLPLPIWSAVDVPSTDQIASLAGVPLMMSELALGLVAGLVMTVLFAAAGIAGDRIASTAGLSFAAQFDPAAGGQTPILGQIFSLSLVLIFFLADGHLTALRILQDSYAVLPPGAPVDVGLLLQAGVEAGGAMFALGLSIMLPVVSMLLLLNLAIGIVTRSAPQLNIFSFGFPLTMAATLLLLFLTAPGLMTALEGLVDNALQAMSAVLGGADG